MKMLGSLAWKVEMVLLPSKQPFRLPGSRFTWKGKQLQQVRSLLTPALRRTEKLAKAYLVQAVLVTREREGESQRERDPLHPHVLQKVGNAVHNVVKELQDKKKMQDASCFIQQLAASRADA